MNNPMQIFQEFNQFRNNFKGDPKQMVQQMVASGQMTQQQLNQLQGQATAFMNAMRQMGIKL